MIQRLEDIGAGALVVVDEAHRMAAHFWGDEVRKTLRYQLGELLGACAQHLLLMTATPHNGKEEDFQLFCALLDSDQFAGRIRDGGDGRRRNTVGFALTVLQRRLASSPEAIYQSPRRRRLRLQNRVVEERQAARATRLGLSGRQMQLSRLLAADDAAAALDYDAYDELDDDEQSEIDAEVPTRVAAAISDPVLASDVIGCSEVERIRRDMDEAAMRRIQPHCVQAFFEAALSCLRSRSTILPPTRTDSRPRSHKTPSAGACTRW